MSSTSQGMDPMMRGVDRLNNWTDGGLWMNQIERAVFDVRRGQPIVITSATGWTLVQALETCSDAAFASLEGLAGNPPALLLARRRLAALGLAHHLDEGDEARVVLPATISGAQLTQFAAGANPGSMWRGIDGAAAVTPASAVERAGLELTHRALLLPAALAAPVTDGRLPSVRDSVADGGLLAAPLERIQAYLERRGGDLKRTSEAHVPLENAPQSRFVLFRESDGLREHVAVVIGDLEAMAGPVPVRIHSACLTGDLFGSLRCDCGEQLRNAVAKISAMGGGVLLYLAQEGRGIGLANKLRAYGLQDTGLDTVDADRMLGFGEDERHYHAAVDMLSDLGIRQARLLTNNPDKLRALAEGGIEVTERRGLYGRLNDHNRRYLSAKAERAGHLLDEVFAKHPRQD